MQIYYRESPAPATYDEDATIFVYSRVGGRKESFPADALSRSSIDQLLLDDELCDVHNETAVTIQFADRSLEDLQLQEVS